MIRFKRRLRFLSSVLVCLMACLASVFAFCGTAVAATATTSTPAWLDQYYSDRYYVNPPWEASSSMGGWQDDAVKRALMDPDYLERCQTVKAPAPEGTSLSDAIKHGYTTFWEDFGNGEMLEMNVSDRQQTFAETWRLDEGEIIDAYKHDSTGKELNRRIRSHRAEGNKLTMTSSEISNMTKKTKLPSSNIIASAKQGTTSFNQKFKTALKKTLKPVKSGVKVTDAMVEKSYKASLGTILKAGGARMLTLVGGASDVLTAAQVGIWVGNGLVGFLNIDQAEECRVMTNKVVRFALGLDSACSKFSTGNVQVGNLSVQLPEKVNWVVYRPNGANGDSRIESRWKFTKFYVEDPYLVIGLKFDTRYSTDSGLSNSYFRLQKPVSGIDNLQVIQWLSGAPYALLRYGSSPCGYNSNSVFPDRGTCTAALSGGFSFDPNKYEGVFTFEDDQGNPQSEPFDPGKIRTNKPKAKTKVKVHGSDGKDYETEAQPTDQGGNFWIPDTALPDGVTPTHVTVTRESEDGGDSKTYVDANVGTSSRAAGVLDLIDVATGKSCYEESFSCATWAGDVAKVTGKPVTLESTATSTSHPTLPYKCVWKAATGSMSELPIGECTVLSNSFQDTNITAGTTGTDPDTGDHIDDPVTDPTPHEKVDYATCVKTDVSWNPVSWVFVPVKCGLQWAFEPDREQLETQSIRIQQKAHMSGLNELPAAFKESFGALQGTFGQHCQGPEMHISAFGHDLIPSSHPFSVCQGTGLEMLPTFSRAGFVVLSCAVCYVTIRKWLSAMFGFGIGNSETGDGK